MSGEIECTCIADKRRLSDCQGESVLCRFDIQSTDACSTVRPCKVSLVSMIIFRSYRTFSSDRIGSSAIPVAIHISLLQYEHFMAFHRSKQPYRAQSSFQSWLSVPVRKLSNKIYNLGLSRLLDENAGPTFSIDAKNSQRLITTE